jgi:hypothetical protein
MGNDSDQKVLLRWSRGVVGRVAGLHLLPSDHRLIGRRLTDDRRQEVELPLGSRCDFTAGRGRGTGAAWS